MSKLLLSFIVASVLGVSSSGVPEKPVPTEAQASAARAASCASFPKHVVAGIEQHFDPDGVIVFGQLPDEYVIRHVVVYSEGGCLSEIIEPLPVIEPGDELAVHHAIGIVDVSASKSEARPFYVLIELDGPPSSRREYYVLQLPAPEIPDATARPTRTT